MSCAHCKLDCCCPRYVSEEEAGKRLAKVVADDNYAQSGGNSLGHFTSHSNLPILTMKTVLLVGVYFSWGGESGT